MVEDDEKRRYLRTDRSVDIVINDMITGWTNNLGLGGISAFIRAELPLFEDIKIVLKLHNSQVVLNGQCLRINKLEEGFYNVAICFQNVGRHSKNAILSFSNLV